MAIRGFQGKSLWRRVVHEEWCSDRDNGIAEVLISPDDWSTYLAVRSTSCYPSLSVDATGRGVVSHAGAVTLLRTAQRTGLTSALSTALAPWRKRLASHDSGEMVLDVAVALAIGGEPESSPDEDDDHPVSPPRSPESPDKG